MAEFWKDFNRKKKKKVQFTKEKDDTEIKNKDHESFDSFSEGGILAILLSLWHLKITEK